MSSTRTRMLPVDADVRAAVLDVSQSWMLQAPAGSGKTELLMQRFLACLAAPNVQQPESVLAITFTRKAAGEMRNRILRALDLASTLPTSEIAEREEHAQRTIQLARAVLDRSDELGWNLLDNPSRLQVRTFDSFCEAISTRAPFKGALGGSAQVTDEPAPLYREAARRVVNELGAKSPEGEAVATLLAHVDNHYETACSLLSSLLARRDQWLRFLGGSHRLSETDLQNLRASLEDALRRSVEDDLARVLATLGQHCSASQCEELFGHMRYAAVMHEDPQHISSQLADITEWPSARAEELPRWRAICNSLLTTDERLRRKVDRRNGFPSDTDEQKLRRDNFLELLEELSSCAGSEQLCADLCLVRRLPDPTYTDEQWLLLRAILVLLPLAAANLRVVFAEEGLVDFSEIAMRASDALGPDGSPTELAFQLGYRINHVLVDEFQDTSRAQTMLLERLLATWEDDEACTTFYVGDPMQSIYAFRQADVSIYLQARDSGIGGHQHTFDKLRQNFRSQASLVEWFNQVFPHILSDENDVTNAVRYTDSTASQPSIRGEAVIARGFGTVDEEASYVAGEIRKELAKPFAVGTKPATIAVLVRARTHLVAITEALREHRIKYRAVKVDRLSDRPLVIDLEALRSAIYDLANRTAWLSVLRAPWCGLSLQDLWLLCRNDRTSTVRELANARAPQLSRDGQDRLARCMSVMNDAVALRGRTPVRQVVEAAWVRLGGHACLRDREQDLRDAVAYFDLLDKSTAAGELKDSEQFRSRLNELYAPADTSSDVRVEVMVIHQAKGLEWDVVFLPALAKETLKQDTSLLYWRERRRSGHEELLLGPMEAVGSKLKRKGATIESYLRDISDDCGKEETKRLLYVAATRARRRLYLSAVLPEGKKPGRKSMLSLLTKVPGLEDKFAAPLGEPEQLTLAAAAESSHALYRLPQSWAPPEPPSPVLEGSVSDALEHSFDWVGDLLPRVGTVTHSFLQRIAAEGLDRWSVERVSESRVLIARALVRAGVSSFDLDKATARVLDALRTTLQDERGRWTLGSHPEQQSELAMSAMVDGAMTHIRVDRTFVEDGVRWLIDYKISDQEGSSLQRFLELQEAKYRPDLERYVRVMRSMDSRPVRCGLYFPLLGKWHLVDISY